MNDFNLNNGGGNLGGGGRGGGGGGGGNVQQYGFERFEQGGPGASINTLPSVPAMKGSNTGYAYPPPSVCFIN